MTVISKKIVLLKGDGVGPEVVGEAVKALLVMNEFTSKTNISLEFDNHLIGGCAIDEAGSALPDSTLDACRKCDAILLGAVGGPQWPRPGSDLRPEQGLLKIRKELGLYANIRPCFFPGTSLVSQSPLRPEIVSGALLWKQLLIINLNYRRQVYCCSRAHWWYLFRREGRGKRSRCCS